MSGTGPKRCVTLTELAERLRSTDLVPSQQPLLEHTEERLAGLAAAGITSVADILEHLKYRESVPSVAARTGIDEDYLILLRRAVRAVAAGNEDRRDFNATIGERDVRRIIDAAGYAASTRPGPRHNGQTKRTRR